MRCRLPRASASGPLESSLAKPPSGAIRDGTVGFFPCRSQNLGGLGWGSELWEGRVLVIPIFKVLQFDILANSGEHLLKIR